MKKLILLFLISFFSFTSQANSEIYGSCGAKPNFLDKMLTNADKIRQKCIEDVYAKNKENIQKEITELIALSKQLEPQIKKVAIKVTAASAQCYPLAGEPPRDPKLIEKCKQLIESQNAIKTRINYLTGWSDTPRPEAKASSKAVNDSLAPPCPSPKEMEDLKVARMFNRKLFEMWERCVADNPESYYYK